MEAEAVIHVDGLGLFSAARGPQRMATVYFLPECC